MTMTRQDEDQPFLEDVALRDAQELAHQRCSEAFRRYGRIGGDVLVTKIEALQAEHLRVARRACAELEEPASRSDEIAAAIEYVYRTRLQKVLMDSASTRPPFGGAAD